LISECSFLSGLGHGRTKKKGKKKWKKKKKKKKNWSTSVPWHDLPSISGRKKVRGGEEKKDRGIRQRFIPGAKTGGGGKKKEIPMPAAFPIPRIGIEGKRGEKKGKEATQHP